MVTSGDADSSVGEEKVKSQETNWTDAQVAFPHRLTARVWGWTALGVLW